MNKAQTIVYKGLAILSVMLCHAMGTFGNGITLFTPLGGIGVSIFLLLSSYGLNESWLASWEGGGGGTYHCWWRKRFITVWIPYIIVQLVAYWPFHEFQFIPFLLDLTLIQPLYHNGWYLQYLFIWYVVFYVIRRVSVLDKHRLIVFTAVSVVLFFSLREIQAEQSLSFLLGILLSERKELQPKLFKEKYGILLLLFGIGCLALKQLSMIRSTPQLMMNLVQLGIKMPIGLGLVIMTHTVLKEYWLKVFYGVGVISYELYLIHGYVLSVVPVSIFGAILFVMLTATASVAYWWVMKKMKPVWFGIFRVTKNVF